VLEHYEYDAYATVDDDIVTTEAQTDEDIVREDIRMGNMIQNRKKRIKKRRRKNKKQSCQLPL
jgi:hypothetical protein